MYEEILIYIAEMAHMREAINLSLAFPEYARLANTIIKRMNQSTCNTMFCYHCDRAYYGWTTWCARCPRMYCCMCKDKICNKCPTYGPPHCLTCCKK